jgi:LAO/AO transport system kinase
MYKDQIFKSVHDIAEHILSGNRRALAKGISMIESSLDEDREKTEELLKLVLPHTGNSMRLGITGSPGVGKSTFIEKFGLYSIQQNKKPAILAIDPSSQSHGGSILGDKVRMPELSRHQSAFIRPSPSKGTLGGVGNSTREAILLCEAAGFDIIIIETVGVGQSEVDVRSMTDLFLLLLLPTAGDEVQGIKRGIMELADIIFINKADGSLLPLAEIAKSQIASSLTLMNSPTEHWNVPVLIGSGLHGNGITDLWNTCLSYFYTDTQLNGYIQSRRNHQHIEWFETAAEKELMRMAENTTLWKTLKKNAVHDIIHSNNVPSFSAKNMIKEFISLCQLE